MSGVFGRSVFGDAVSQPTDPSVSVPVGTHVPSEGVWPLRHDATRTMPVSAVDPRTRIIGPAVAPPGSIIGAGESRALRFTRGVTQPVTAVDPRTIPVGRMRDPRPGLMPTQEAAYWLAWLRKFHPGVFHRPPLVGSNRYASYHPFGPPSLGGFRGFGSPDGLVGFGG